MVVGVDLGILGLRLPAGRLHLVRLARDDQTVQVLHAPARLHELDGQPVEKLVVHGPWRSQAEVERRCDERFSKMSHPDMVDGNSRRQRVPAVDDPARQCESPARADRRVRLVAGLVSKARLGTVIDERSRRVSGRWRLSGRGLGLEPLLLGLDEPAARVDDFRGGLEDRGLQLRIFRGVARRREPLHGPPGAIQGPLGEQALVAGLVNRQLFLGRASVLGRLDPRGGCVFLRSFVLEPLGAEHGLESALPELGQRQCRIRNGQLVSGVIGLQPGASQRTDRRDRWLPGPLRLVGLAESEA